MFQMGGGDKRPEPKARAAAAKPARAVTVTVKLDAARRAKFESLGGEQWLREQIDRATVPKP
jgi:hypothetical protein